MRMLEGIAEPGAVGRKVQREMMWYVIQNSLVLCARGSPSFRFIRLQEYMR